MFGIRPGQMKDAALTTAAPADMRLRAVVDLREELGEESLLHYRVAARAVLSEDVEEAIADEAVDAAPVGDDLAARFVARVDARSRAGTGDTIEFYLDTKELHFFDPETHLAIDDAKVVSRKRVLLSP